MQNSAKNIRNSNTPGDPQFAAGGEDLHGEDEATSSEGEGRQEREEGQEEVSVFNFCGGTGFGEKFYQLVRRAIPVALHLSSRMFVQRYIIGV